MRNAPEPTPPSVLILDELDEGVSQMSFDITAETLGVDPGDMNFPAPVRVQVSIGRTMQMFTVDGRVSGAVAGECCRCLQPAGADFTSKFRFLLQRKEASNDEVEALEDEEDVDLVDPGTKEVDLVDRLRDAVVLELPLRLYCKQDCKGLCPQCGQDFNSGDCSCADEAIDPRWEALASLKK